jgi:putative tRNA adenosine deaminase-associated protein
MSDFVNQIDADGPDLEDELEEFDEDDPEDFDDSDDDYEDATPEEIDFVVAIYREDGQPVALKLAPSLANDLDDLIAQLRRLPGDAGACAFVSIAGEFFVICRVRGRVVQVLLSDSLSANDWPIARDVIDYLGLEIPEDEDDADPVGDFALLADQGVSEFDMETIVTTFDEESDVLVLRIIDQLKFTDPFKRAVAGK